MLKKNIINPCSIVVAVFIQLLAISCNNRTAELPLNIEMKSYENGNIKYIKVRSNTEGIKTLWFGKNGNIDSIQNKQDSLLEGQIIWFYPNGNIENIAQFKSGNHNGTAFMFYEDGAIKNHRCWKNNKRVGYATDYYQDSIGTLKNMYFYNNDTIEWWRPSSGHSLGIGVSPTRDSTR